MLLKFGRQLGVMKASVAQWSEMCTLLTSDCNRMVLLSARQDRFPSSEGVKYRRSVRAAYQQFRAVSKQLKSVPTVCNRRVPAVLAVQALPNGHIASVFGRFLTLAYLADPSADHALPSVWSYCTRSKAEFTPVFNGTSCGVH